MPRVPCLNSSIYPPTNGVSLRLSVSAEIQQEKSLQNHLDGIENFDANKLKHADTVEKNPLPTADGTIPMSVQLYGPAVYSTVPIPRPSELAMRGGE